MAAEPVAPDATVPVAGWALPTVVALVLAVVSALATPLMGLPDEPAHTVYAAAVVRGELGLEDVVVTDEASGWTRTDTHLDVPQAYAELPALPLCFAFQPEVPADCARELPPEVGPTIQGNSTVGTYAPAWYAAVGWLSLVLPPTAAVVGMRVMAALLFAGFVGVAAAALARAGARAWAWVGLALALPPVAVHLGGGINPSGTEIAGGVALWATSAALVVGARRRADVVRWVVAGVTVAVTRPLGPAITLGVVVVAVGVLGRSVNSAWQDRRVRLASLAVAGALVAGLGWSLWRGTLSAFSGFPVPEATGMDAVRRSLALVPERLTELVGVLGWSDVSLPMVLVGAWLLAVAGLAAAGVLVRRTRERVWLAVLAVVVLVLPIVADVRSAPTIGFVWQGRYTLPVAAGLPLLGGLLLDGAAPSCTRRSRIGVATVLGLWGVGHVVALVAVLRRFRVGADGAVADALAAPGVHVGVAGWMLLAIACVAAAIPAVVSAGVRSRGRRASVGEVSGDG